MNIFATNKVPHTNLKKQDKFIVGGYARSRAFGTRVYKVLGVTYEATPHDTPWGCYQNQQVAHLELAKVGETNRGRFKFTNGRPFKTNNDWYYPAKGV